MTYFVARVNTSHVNNRFFYLSFPSAVHLSCFRAPPHCCIRTSDSTSRCKMSLKHRRTTPAITQGMTTDGWQKHQCKGCANTFFQVLWRTTHHLYLGGGPRRGGTVGTICLAWAVGETRNILALPCTDYFRKSHLFWTLSQARSRQNTAPDESHMLKSSGENLVCVSALLLQGTWIPEIHEHLQRIYFLSTITLEISTGT